MFRTRILQDVAEYALRTADRESVAGDFAKESAIAEPPAHFSRDDRTSANLTSASAIALGPWAVFALSFLILAAFRDEIESILDPSLSAAIDLDGLGEFSKTLADEPSPVRMFAQAGQATDQILNVSSEEVFDAPLFGAGPVLSGPTSGPFAVAMLPDEIFNFNLTDTKDALDPLRADDRPKDFTTFGVDPDTGRLDEVKFDKGLPDDGSGLVLNGSSQDDNLVGSTGNDLMFGFGGNDKFSALGGEDILVSGEGNNHLNGGPGFDIAAFLAPSTEYVIYRNADGSFTVENKYTGDETQLVEIESLYFTDGNYNVTEFAEQIGRVDTSNQLDTRETTQNLIDAHSGSGNGGAIIRGDDRDNDLRGTSGNDVIYGNGGEDRLSGLEGEDILVGGDGGGWIDGGAGNDVAAFSMSSTVISLHRDVTGAYLLRDNKTGDETVLTNVERVLFKDGFVDLTRTGVKPEEIIISDWLDSSVTYGKLIGEAGGGGTDPGDDAVNHVVGTDLNDTLIGGAGNDHIAGRGGDDLVVAEPGNDLIDGGDGHDIAAFQGQSTNYELYLMSDGSFSLVNNLTEAETILVNVEEIYFSDGFVKISALDRGGLVDLRALLDTSATSGDLMAQHGGDGQGGEGDGGESEGGESEGGPVLVPPGGGQTVIGGAGNDDLAGTAYDDIFVGGAGDDRISGLGGSDIIYDGPGNDLVDGGAGIDLLALRGASSDYALYAMSDGSFSLVNDRTDQETVLRNVEQLYFADGFVDLSGLDKLDGRIDMAFLLDGSATSGDLPAPPDTAGDKTDDGKGGDGTDTTLGLLLMGDPGDNDLVGTEKDDMFFGGPGNDRISGLGGEDVIIADPGSDLIDGGDGFDIAGFQGASGSYALYSHGDGSFTVENTKQGDATRIVNVESVHFNDGNIDLTDLPDEEGVVFMGDLLDTDANVTDLFGLADSYEPETGEDDTTDPILVLVPPPVYSPPLELMPNPETGETL